MRFKEITKSGNDAPVYNFAIGKAELIILRDVLDHLHKVVPNSFFTMPFNSRVRNMRTEVHKVCQENGLSKKLTRAKGWDPDDMNEVL